ncbi:Hint domain-containing protein [Thalassovita taeanensis]|uniref:Hint domain-containing protein n=1 Tax=Thalassovita taeanensis TaxID=657014 RepID=A0A1H9FFG2_9RHOB|nr:Hint domain-containing protein [Thalassovita taeanensis]SEQ36691.1 Hint domain-containing protein [Thalassovita taeanensis]
MPTYSLWMLDKADVTVSGGGSLDGVTQGTGAQLDGLTITLNAPNWHETRVYDDDRFFDDNDGNQRLSGTQTINGVSYSGGTSVEAEYTVVLRDPATGQTYTAIAYNVVNSSPGFGTIEGLSFVGGPLDWPPVGVALDVISTSEGPGNRDTAYSDYVIPCFAPCVRILTDRGEVRVEDLRTGDGIVTMDAGVQPLSLLAQTRLTAEELHAAPHLAPIRIRKGAFGESLPNRDTKISPQHRFLMRSAKAALLFGDEEVLVPANAFLGRRGIETPKIRDVTYFHLLLADHHVIYANGAATESLLVGEALLQRGPEGLQRELCALFPELANPATVQRSPEGIAGMMAARSCLRRWEAQLLVA